MRKYLKNLILQKLLRMITEDDFLKYKDNQLFIGNKPLPVSDMRMLINEAETIQNMYLYKLLQNELAHIINSKIFLESQNFDDVWFGKGGLWILDIIKNKVANISKLEIK